MIPSINAEIFQLRHRWMPWILFIISAVIVALIMFGVAHAPTDAGNVDFPHGLITATVYGGFFGPVLWPILAGSMAGQDYGWGTIRITLTARPSRIQHALAGFIVAMLAVAAAMIGILLVGALMGLLVSATTNSSGLTAPMPSDFSLIVVKVFLAQLYCTSLFVLIGFAAGTIFRSTAAGVGLGLGSWIGGQIIYLLLYGLGALNPIFRSIAEKLPFAFTQDLPQRLASPALTSGFGGSSSDPVSIGGSILGIAIYMALFLGLMLFVVAKRDVTS